MNKPTIGWTKESGMDLRGCMVAVYAGPRPPRCGDPIYPSKVRWLAEYTNGESTLLVENTGQASWARFSRNGEPLLDVSVGQYGSDAELRFDSCSFMKGAQKIVGALRIREADKKMDKLDQYQRAKVERIRESKWSGEESVRDLLSVIDGIAPPPKPKAQLLYEAMAATDETRSYPSWQLATNTGWMFDIAKKYQELLEENGYG